MPQFDSCRSTDGRCSVGSPNAAVFLKLGQTPSTSAQNDCCLSLLGALSPCPTVNAALCPRLSSTLPSPSRVHNCPIVSHSAVHRVFSTPQPAALALSLFYFRVQALFQTHAPLSPCCWCFLLSHGPLLPLARTRLSVGALAGLTTRFHDVGLRGTRGSHCRTLWAKLPQATSSAVCWNVSPCRQLCRAFFQIPLFTLQG